MRANQSEHLRRSKEFVVGLNRLRASQIETMIAEFDRICIDLGLSDRSRGDACSDLRPDVFCVSNLCEGCSRTPREDSAVGGGPQD